MGIDYYKLIVESTNNAIIGYNPEKNFIFWNRAAEKLYGWKSSDIIGKHIDTIVPPEYLDQIIQVIDLVLAGEEVAEVDTVRIRKDGIRVNVTINFSPIKNESGKIIGVATIAYENTAKKRVEDALQESERLYKEIALTLEIERNKLATIIDSLPVGVGIGDVQGNILSLNKVGLKLHWYKSEADMLARISHFMEDYDLKYMDGREIPIQELLIPKALRGEYVTNYEVQLVNRKTHEERFLSYTVAPVKNKENATIFLLYVVQDITEREHSSKKLQQLADSMPQLVWTANPDGKVDYYNKKYLEFDGIYYSNNEWQWAPVVHPDDAEATNDAWNYALQNGTMYEIEHRIKMKNSHYRWFLSRGVPVTDNQGTIIKWYGTATDIHERKKLEQQKDDFLSVASHELKTPVTSIKAYTQVLQRMFDKKGDEFSVNLLGKMNGQLNKLTSLIEDLLDVTKIESGKLQFREDFFNVNDLIKEIVVEVQRTTKSHTLILKLDEEVIVYGDRDRIGQVVTNFLTNAIKYSPKAKKVIVDTELGDKQVTVCVEDFGVGIPEDKKDLVFERFYRVEGENEATFPGLGLGLYICKEIISRQNGTIWVESKLGKGSKFCFSLPISSVRKIND